MGKKKCLSILLTIIFVVSSTFTTNSMEKGYKQNKNAQYNEAEAMEFYKKSSELVKKNWNDDYFDSLKIKVGSNYLTDESDKKVKLSSKVSIEDDVVMVPINEIVEIAGGEVNQNAKKAEIDYLGNTIELKEDSNKIDVNDKVKTIEKEPTINEDNIKAPIDVLTEGLGYTCDYNKKSKEITITSPYQTMRLIVKLKNTNVDLDKYKAVETIKGLNNIVVLQFDSIEDTKLACEQIKKDKIAVYAEPDIYISGESTQKVSPSNGSGAYNSWGVNYIEADKFASYLQKQNLNNSITVGVVDSGIDYDHPIFKNRIKSGGYDFVNGDKYPYDDLGHGTHVSGTIVDCTPGLNIKILPVKVLNYNNEGSGLDIANGIEYAANKGVDVINFSIQMYSHSSYIHDVIENAISKNVVVVVAAGNNSNNTVYECPSDMYDAVVVSAIDHNGQICDFSNYGSTIDVAAPGYDIYSAYPGCEYAYMDGTSMAAPHISAACAMYRLKNPKLSVSQVEKLLKKNTKDLGEKGWDEQYGYGTPKLSLAFLKQFSKLTVNKISTSSKSISGKGQKGATVKAYVNGKQIGKTTKVSSSGNYKISIPKQSAGKKIVVKMSKSGYKTKSISTTVLKVFKTFTVNSIKSTSKSISGKGLKGATVKAYVNGKQIGKTTKVSSSGNYKISISKQKKGKKITVKMSKSGYLTTEKSVVVK